MVCRVRDFESFDTRLSVSINGSCRIIIVNPSINLARPIKCKSIYFDSVVETLGGRGKQTVTINMTGYTHIKDELVLRVECVLAISLGYFGNYKISNSLSYAHIQGQIRLFV